MLACCRVVVLKRVVLGCYDVVVFMGCRVAYCGRRSVDEGGEASGVLWEEECR